MAVPFCIEFRNLIEYEASNFIGKRKELFVKNAFAFWSFEPKPRRLIPR